MQLDPIFLDEARDNLDRMERALLSLGSSSAEPELLDSIYRCVHSIKGGSASFGLSHLAELMHVSESVLVRWRQDPATPDVASTGLLLDAIVVSRRQLSGETASDAAAIDLARRLRKLGKPAERGMPVRLVHIVVRPPHRRDLLEVVTGLFRDFAALGELVDASGEADGAKAFVIRSDARERELLDLLAMHVDRGQVTFGERTHGSASTPFVDAHRIDQLPGHATVRVPAHELDLIVSMSQELLDSSDRFQRLSHSLVPSNSVGNVSSLLGEAAGLQRLAMRLREAIGNVKNAPLSELFDFASRLIGHLSITLDKEFIQDFSGQDVRVDRIVLQALVDPFVHIVRNSCDHGIESPAERLAMGKPQAGCIRLKAQSLDGAIRIVAQDDGRGLSRSDLLRAAKLAGSAVSEDMRDEDVWQLIFLPGVSTATSLTQVSGRGVGMDVVRNTVQALGGTVGISATPGKGTTVTIDVPTGQTG